MGTIGVSAQARRGNCTSSIGTHLTSILDWSHDKGAELMELVLFKFKFNSNSKAFNWINRLNMFSYSTGRGDRNTPPPPPPPPPPPLPTSLNYGICLKRSGWFSITVWERVLWLTIYGIGWPNTIKYLCHLAFTVVSSLSADLRVTEALGSGRVLMVYWRLRHGNQPDHLAWQMERKRRRRMKSLGAVPACVRLHGALRKLMCCIKQIPFFLF